jgi:DNA-directed RNA polymerase subunit RPC12/RpoP
MSDDDPLASRGSIEPTPGTRATMECGTCGATFPRTEAETPEKGSLACPECGSTTVTDTTRG